MTHRILVPLDGSELAEKVVPWVDAWAIANGAEVELLRVVSSPVPSVFVGGVSVADYYLTEQDVLRAHRTLEEMATRFSASLRVDVSVVEGAPAEAILDHARERAADLIMMSTHGRGGLTRIVLGSVAGAVLRRSSVPVMTVRAELAGLPRAPRRVLVPLNDSDLAAAILPRLVLFAAPMQLDLVLYWVAPGMAYQRADAEPFRALAGGLQAAGIHSEVEIEQGADPAATIASLARKGGFDLIAMSTHGRSGLARWTLGSVTEWTIRHADVPVMAIRSRVVPARDRVTPRESAHVAEPVI